MEFNTETEVDGNLIDRVIQEMASKFICSEATKLIHSYPALWEEYINKIDTQMKSFDKLFSDDKLVFPLRYKLITMALNTISLALDELNEQFLSKNPDIYAEFRKAVTGMDMKINEISFSDKKNKCKDRERKFH